MIFAVFSDSRRDNSLGLLASNGITPTSRPVSMPANKRIPSIDEPSSQYDSPRAWKEFTRNADVDDDTNSGVRELSEDETGLREMDENDMNNTDEFIVFANQMDSSDDCHTDSSAPRQGLNRLYTFAKVNDQPQLDNGKRVVSNQVCCDTRRRQMIVS